MAMAFRRVTVPVNLWPAPRRGGQGWEGFYSSPPPSVSPLTTRQQPTRAETCSCLLAQALAVSALSFCPLASHHSKVRIPCRSLLPLERWPWTPGFFKSPHETSVHSVFCVPLGHLYTNRHLWISRVSTRLRAALERTFIGI